MFIRLSLCDDANPGQRFALFNVNHIIRVSLDGFEENAEITVIGGENKIVDETVDEVLALIKQSLGAMSWRPITSKRPSDGPLISYDYDLGRAMRGRPPSE